VGDAASGNQCLGLVTLALLRLSCEDLIST
jgi:hypothetical protein